MNVDGLIEVAIGVLSGLAGRKVEEVDAFEAGAHDDGDTSAKKTTDPLPRHSTLHALGMASGTGIVFELRAAAASGGAAACSGSAAVVATMGFRVPLGIDADPTELPAHVVAKAQAAFTAMKSAVPVDIPGSKSGARIIKLPATLEWPQFKTAALFVRHFYEDFYEGPLRLLEPGATFVISGNPGIGVSAFGIYLLWVAVKAGRTVVYLSDKDPFGYIFHADGKLVMKSQSKAFLHATSVLGSKETVLLFDGAGGLGESAAKSAVVKTATTVLLTAPEWDRWRFLFDLHGPEILFTFPVFSSDEINDMLESCFENLQTPAHRKLVADKFALWGGIPRYVLAQARWADLDKRLAMAAGTMPVAAVASALDHAWSVYELPVPLLLFHLVPAGKPADGEFVGGTNPADYRLDRLELGSRQIASLVFTALHRPPHTHDAKGFATVAAFSSLSMV